MFQGFMLKVICFFKVGVKVKCLSKKFICCNAYTLLCKLDAGPINAHLLLIIHSSIHLTIHLT